MIIDLKNKSAKRGAALITVLAVTTILLSFIQGVWVNSRLEHASSYQKLRELKSRYSARSGMELSLLSIYIYKEADKLLQKSPEISEMVGAYMNTIWSVPFLWPFPVSEDLLKSDKASLKKIINEAYLKESYNIKIYPEDGRLDINDLSSPITYLRKFTFDTLLNFLILSIEDQPELKDKYNPASFTVILNNISDWSDEDNESQNGGSEETIEEGHIPLNRSFMHIEELKKVPGVTKEIYDFLKPHTTVYGSKGLSINYTTPEILRALNLPEIIVEDILNLTRIGSENYSPFKDTKNFCDYLVERGSPLCENIEKEYETLEIFQFNTVSHFRLEAWASSHKIRTFSEALIYDPLKAIENYKRSLDIQEKISKGELEESKKNRALSKEEEKSKKTNLNLPRSIARFPFYIMYWKENF